MRWRWLKVAFTTVAIALAALMVAGEFVIALSTLLITVLAGWMSSLARMLARWRPGLGEELLFGAAVIALAAGSHGFARWFHNALIPPAEKNDRLPRKWRFRWTLCGLGLAFCALLAVGSVVLTVHQTYWMSRSSDPWFVSKSQSRLAVLRAALFLHDEAEKHHWKSAGTRAAFWRADAVTGGQPAWEMFRAIWVENAEGTLQAIVLVPRRPMLRASDRIAVLEPGTRYAWHELDRLPQVLASLGIGRNVAANQPAPRSSRP